MRRLGWALAHYAAKACEWLLDTLEERRQAAAERETDRTEPLPPRTLNRYDE